MALMAGIIRWQTNQHPRSVGQRVLAIQTNLFEPSKLGHDQPYCSRPINAHYHLHIHLNHHCTSSALFQIWPEPYIEDWKDVVSSMSVSLRMCDLHAQRQCNLLPPAHDRPWSRSWLSEMASRQEHECVTPSEKAGSCLYEVRWF